MCMSSVFTEMDFNGMKRTLLQALCKELDIHANMKNIQMVEALNLFFKGKDFGSCVTCVRDTKVKRQLLQALCKQHGIRANMKNTEMIKRITLLFEGNSDSGGFADHDTNLMEYSLVNQDADDVQIISSNDEYVQGSKFKVQGIHLSEVDSSLHGSKNRRISFDRKVAVNDHIGAPTVNSNLAFVMDAVNVENESKYLKGLDIMVSVESEDGVRTSQSALLPDCMNSGAPDLHKKRKGSFVSDDLEYRGDIAGINNSNRTLYEGMENRTMGSKFDMENNVPCKENNNSGNCLIEGDRGSTLQKPLKVYERRGKAGSKAQTSNLCYSNEGSETQDSDESSIDKKAMAQVDMESEKSAVETIGELDPSRRIQRDTTQTPLDSSPANQFGYEVQAQCALAGGLNVNHIAINFDDSALLDDRLLPDGLVVVDKLLNDGDLYCSKGDNNKPKDLDIVDEDQDYQEDEENKEGAREVGYVLVAMHDPRVDENPTSKDHSEELPDIQKGKFPEVPKQDDGEQTSKELEGNVTGKRKKNRYCGAHQLCDPSFENYVLPPKGHSRRSDSKTAALTELSMPAEITSLLEEQKIDFGLEVQEPAGNEIETDSCFNTDDVELSRKKRKGSRKKIESAVKDQPASFAVSTIDSHFELSMDTSSHLNGNQLEEIVNFQGTCMFQKEQNSVQPIVESVALEDAIFSKSPLHSNSTAGVMGDRLLPFNRMDTDQENTVEQNKVVSPDKISSMEVSSNLARIKATEEATEGIAKSSEFDESAHPDLHKIDGQVVVDKYRNEVNDSEESKKTFEDQMLPTFTEKLHEDIENGSNLVLTDGQVADYKFSHEIIVNAPEESKENCDKSSVGDKSSITLVDITVDELESGTMPVVLESDGDCQNSSSCGFSCGNNIESTTKDQPVSFAVSTVDSHFELSMDTSAHLTKNPLEESVNFQGTSMFHEEQNAVQPIVSLMESVAVEDAIFTYQPECEGQTSSLLDLNEQSEADSLIVQSINQSGCVLDDQSENGVIASVPEDHKSIDEIVIVQVDMDSRKPAEAAAETVGEMQLSRTVPSDTTLTPLDSSPVKQVGNEVQAQCTLAGGINISVIGTNFDDIALLESQNTDGQVAEVKLSEIADVTEYNEEKYEDEFSCGDRSKVEDNKSVEELYHARIKATINEEANEGIDKSSNFDESALPDLRKTDGQVAVDKYWNKGLVNASEESKEKLEAQMLSIVAEDVQKDIENGSNLVLTDGQVADDKFSNEIIVNALEESKENSEHKSSVTLADRIVDETESGTMPVVLESDGDCQNSSSCGFTCDNDEYDLGGDKEKLEENEIVDEYLDVLEYEENKEWVHDVGELLDAIHDLSVDKNESSKDHSEELLNIQKGVSRQDVGETSVQKMDVNRIDNAMDPGNSKNIFEKCDQVGTAISQVVAEELGEYNPQVIEEDVKLKSTQEMGIHCPPCFTVTEYSAHGEADLKESIGVSTTPVRKNSDTFIPKSPKNRIVEGDMKENGRPIEKVINKASVKPMHNRRALEDLTNK